MPTFRDDVERLLRQQMRRRDFDYEEYVASVLAPQNASYCAITLKGLDSTVIKIVGELADDDAAIATQIDQKVIANIAKRRETQ